MTVRRTSAPRKRPASSDAIAPSPSTVRAKTQEPTTTMAAQEEAAGSDLRQDIVQKFEASLREQSGLDPEGLEFMVARFREAVLDAPLAPGLAPPDADSWTQTLNGLVQNGLIEEEERNVLARKFEQAVAVSQSGDAKIALEFAERLQRDGEASAMEWLTRQRGATGRENVDPLSRDRTDTEGKQSITRSRSRRLRGPPTAG